MGEGGEREGREEHPVGFLAPSAEFWLPSVKQKRLCCLAFVQNLFFVTVAFGIIMHSKKKYSTVWSKQYKPVTAQESETSSLYSNLVEGFDIMPTVIAT